MGKIIITEDDKKEILKKYGVGSRSTKKVISEHQRMSELMGLNYKPLILEGNGRYSWITDMPLFSGWKGIIDEMPEVAQRLESEMSNISQTLASRGITSDNIRTKSQEWFTNYSKSLNITKAMTDGDVIELYIKTEMPQAFAEINNKITALTKQGAEFQIDDILREMESDPDFAIRGADASESTNKNLAKNNVDENDLDDSVVDDVINNTESAKTHFNKRVSETQSNINQTRQTAIDAKRPLGDAEKELIAKLEKIKLKYQKVVDNLNIKAERYKKWKEVKSKFPQEGGKVSYLGKEYDMSGMNAFQRLWWKGWISKKLPLEFFKILGKLIYMAFKRQTFTETFLGNIAGMTNALRKMGDNGTEIGKEMAKKAESDLDAYASRLYTELIASVGKPINTPLSFKSFFSDGMGVPGFKFKEMDIQDSFNRLENMIKSVDGISDAERKEIMQNIFNQYMGKSGGAGTPVSELGAFRGWLKYNEDLKSLGVKSSLLDEAGAASKSANDGVKSAEDDFLDFVDEWFTGSAAKDKWRGFIKTMSKKFVNGCLVGIPAGIKWVQRPILKSGLGLKSIGAVMVRLYLTKVAFVVSYGALKALGFMAAYLLEFGKIKEMSGGMTGEEYANKVGNNYLTDIKDAAFSFPWHGIDIGWEEEQNSIPSKVGFAKYNAKLGIFRSYGTEFAKTWYARIFTNKDINVKQEQQDAQREAVTALVDWVDVEAQDTYNNLTPEDKNAMKESAGFNTVKEVVSPTSQYLGELNMTQQNAKNIETRIFFKPLFVGDIENVKAFGSIKEFRKSGRKLTTKDIAGFTYLCSKPIKTDRDGNPVCTGNDYRIVVCNENYFAQDDNYKKYIYNKDTRQVGNMASMYKGQLVYIKNESLKDKFKLEVGENCQNIGLVTELNFI